MSRGRDTPVHCELLLVVRLYRAILWETLDNFDRAVELSVDKLVRVHVLGRGQFGAREVKVGDWKR